MSPSPNMGLSKLASIHPRTQEHMELHLHQHFDTHIEPSCSLHKDANHILCWIWPKMMIPKEAHKCGNTRLRLLDTMKG